MESSPECEPCAAQDKSSLAVTLCSDCDEKLCADCVDHHSKFKAFRSHHLIDLSAVGAKLPSFAKHCDLHEESPLDFYCSQHSVVCCRSCIPLNHQACKDVLPLEVASRNIKDSVFLEDTLGNMNNVLKTLTCLTENRDKNIKKIKDCESVILNQVKNFKDEIMKQVNKLEMNVITDLSTMKHKHETTLEKEKTELAGLITQVLEGRAQIEFLKEHGSNNQLFLALRQQENTVQALESQIEKMTSTFVETELTFNCIKELKIESLCLVTEASIPCKIQHKVSKIKQAQANPEIIKSIASIKWEHDLQLKTEESYNLTGIAITNDNKLLLCNYFFSHHYCYIYSDCDEYETKIKFSSPPYGVLVIPKADMAVVTLPAEKSLQYFNTKTATRCNKIATAEACYGVCAKSNNILLGGARAVYMLDLKGSFLRKIKTPSTSFLSSICFSENSQLVTCRATNRLFGVSLAGEVIYTHTISGESGLTLDGEGNIYYSDYEVNTIWRLSTNGNEKTLICRNDKVIGPKLLSFNKNYSKLFIISECESVQIYSCCQSQ